MQYPDKFIRGISSADFIDEDGRASAGLFQFLDVGREDEFYEASINWYDDEEALSLILEQRKEKDVNEFQFKHGAAIINRSEADRIIDNQLYESIFSYERAPIDANRYHGNLICKEKKANDRKIKNVIAACLALNAQIVPNLEYKK